MDGEILSKAERASLARAMLLSKLADMRSQLPTLMGLAKMSGREEARYQLRMAYEWLAEAQDNVGLPLVEIVNSEDKDETQPIEDKQDTERFEVLE